MILSQGQQKRQGGKRTFASGEQLDVAALAGVVVAVLLVRQAQRVVLVVKPHLPAYRMDVAMLLWWLLSLLHHSRSASTAVRHSSPGGRQLRLLANPNLLAETCLSAIKHRFQSQWLRIHPLERYRLRRGQNTASAAAVQRGYLIPVRRPSDNSVHSGASTCHATSHATSLTQRRPSLAGTRRRDGLSGTQRSPASPSI